MLQSHASLRDDYEVSTSTLNSLVTQLCTTPGVFGARLTGAGFGGCVVALADPEVELDGWRVSPSAGAQVEWQLGHKLELRQPEAVAGPEGLPFVTRTRHG